MYKNYVKNYNELNEQIVELSKNIPEVLSSFASLNKAGIKDGTLDQKTKELVALGIAIALRCDGCIAYHAHDSVKAGATEKEVAEIVGVSVMMGGGPAVVYGAEALGAVRQFVAEEIKEHG